MAPLGTGSLYRYPNGLAVNITIINFADITHKILPLFHENSVGGVKLCDYKDRLLRGPLRGPLPIK